MKYALALALCSLSACADETVAGYSGAGNWRLTEINGTTFTARATLTLEHGGALSGAAPCNRYRGTQTAPYPWFATSALAVTRRACPDLAAETLFFQTLETMTQSEISGDTLILRNVDGHEMVFTRS